ncbi:nucleoplasmin-2 [Sorex araneus]|uniref:nucleoplasmin-2 n=1 Tax=Sorex araneus TaxID=42254 RepID=UPI0024339F68|nr:nucleoplasmin-2 [Sorex araneus]
MARPAAAELGEPAAGFGGPGVGGERGPGRPDGRSLSAAATPRDVSRSRAGSLAERAAHKSLWGCELSQDKRTWTFRAQGERKLDCKVMLSTICLGEKAKEEINLVDIVLAGNKEDKKAKAVTIASLQPSVLPTVVLPELFLSPPVTFQLRAGSGPVFLSGMECYDNLDVSWEEEEEEEKEEKAEEEEEEEEEESDIHLSLEESPVQQTKRSAPQRQTSVAKKKKVLSDDEAARPKAKSPVRKIKAVRKPKKMGSKK